MNNLPLKLLVIACALFLTSCSSNEVELVENNTPEITVNLTEKSIEAEILAKVNDYRVNNGFSPLNKLQAIKTQTSNHTNYMVEKSQVSHDNFYKRKEYLVNNANAVKVGENVAYGYSSASSVVDAWIRSEGHKQNIEGEFTHFEVTAEKDANGKWYFTNIFVKI